MRTVRRQIWDQLEPPVWSYIWDQVDDPLKDRILPLTYLEAGGMVRAQLQPIVRTTQ